LINGEPVRPKWRAGFFLFCAMNFAALTSRVQQLSAGIFGVGIDGRQNRAWFPPALTDSPATTAGYSVPMGAVSIGPVRMKGTDPLGLATRPENLVSVAIDLTVWRATYGDTLPKKSITVFLLGPASENDATTPDPAKCIRCSIAEEARIAGGVMELDAQKHAVLPS